MHRFIAATAAVLSLLTSVGATTTTTRAPHLRPIVQLVRPAALSPAEKPRPAAEFSLTVDSEVILDGRPCPYKMVPAGSTILRIEVEPDGQTIRRIAFRSPR